MQALSKILLSGLVAAFLFSPSAFAQDKPLFDDLVYQARVLVLTGDVNSADHIEQMEILTAGSDALYERDIVVMNYHGRVLETVRNLSIFPRDTRILDEKGERRYMQQRLQTDDDIFSLVLVGKDGQTKQVWREVTPSADIFATIDELPLRLEELSE